MNNEYRVIVICCFFSLNITEKSGTTPYKRVDWCTRKEACIDRFGLFDFDFILSEVSLLSCPCRGTCPYSTHSSFCLTFDFDKQRSVEMAVKITADLRYPEVGLPSSLFSGQRRLNAKSKGGKVSVIRAIQSQEEAAPTSIQYQARRIRRPQNVEGDFFVGNLTTVSPPLVSFWV